MEIKFKTTGYYLYRKKVNYGKNSGRNTSMQLGSGLTVKLLLVRTSVVYEKNNSIWIFEWVQTVTWLKSFCLR